MRSILLALAFRTKDYNIIELMFVKQQITYSLKHLWNI